jgi:CDP-glucose 4,6-dehydratase
MVKPQGAMESLGMNEVSDTYSNVGVKPASINPNFWRDRRVFLTGHTGFKGGWLAIWLSSMGAKVTGYALAPKTEPNFFEVARVADGLTKSEIADIRNLEALQRAIIQSKPEIVIHMAAQPLVRYSYSNPVETYAVNVMGTVHVLESIRNIEGVRAAIVVTTDKCYENKEWMWGYREIDRLGGYDPYSNSKSCAELVASSYRQSYFSVGQNKNAQLAVATVRAGNVIGGGDWSEDRLIPDVLRAFEANEAIKIRNPLAIRPWQHVLEPLYGYLLLAEALFEDGTNYSDAWNFGPGDADVKTVKEVVNIMINEWGSALICQHPKNAQPYETHTLKLDCSKANHHLKWLPRWGIQVAIKSLVQWHRAYKENYDMNAFSLQQISNYQNL